MWDFFDLATKQAKGDCQCIGVIGVIDCRENGVFTKSCYVMMFVETMELQKTDSDMS